jgi:N-acetylmuramoyl-L-alanine amidase
LKKGLIVWGVAMVMVGCISALIPEDVEEVVTPQWEQVKQVNVSEEYEPPEEPTVFYTGGRLEVREFTYQEAQMLMRIAQAEAGNQGKAGMKMIMAVVLNRTRDESFPDSIEGVIFQKHQFQPVSDGRYYKVELSPEVHEALADIERGEPIDESIVAFEITSSNSLDKYFSYAYTVGDHNFYKEKGGTGD